MIVMASGRPHSLSPSAPRSSSRLVALALAAAVKLALAPVGTADVPEMAQLTT